MLAKTNQVKTVNFNRSRMESALSSGKPVKLPKSLTREEKRKFIIKNR